MWILSSDGDFLQGKRIWLKPGKKYLFGRVKSESVRHAIDHKTISRQHMVIEVAKVQRGDGLRIHAKSKITLHDQSSKGTIVNGEPLLKQKKELGDRDEYVIRLGRSPVYLKIEWSPVVLTFSFSSKQLKATKDPTAEPCSRLEDLDVKTVMHYVPGKTSYVVQNKRNTGKALQALVNGKWIVDKSYIDAIIYAATPTELENEEALCPLEEDFDAAWPDPRPHLPPRGREPTELPDSAYDPDHSRMNVFEGYTFVFCEQSKFEDLQGPVTNGHGKALLYKIEYGKTTAEEIVDYLRKVAGNKGLSTDNESGGVMLVQFQGGRNDVDWAQDIQRRVSQLTGQETVLPNEFLDAILRNNASQLCRPLRKEPAQNGTQLQLSENNATQTMEMDLDASPSETRNDAPAVDNSQSATQLTKRSRTRPYIPRFKTFDDDFDMDSIPVYTLEQGDGEPTQEDPQVAAMEPIAEESQVNQSEAAEEEMVADLLPGATAMKQRMGSMKRREPTPPPEPPKKVKRPKLDVKEAARQRREAEDEAAMAEKEDIASFQAIVDGMTVSEMQNLAIKEEMTVRPRPAQSQIQRSDNSRWDEKWNGRKNFKKFRRKGNPGGVVQHRIQTVIVPLEEVRRRDYGLSDRYSPTSRAVSENRRVTEPVTETPALSRTTSNVTSQALSQTQGSAPSVPETSTRAQKRARESEDSDDDGLRFRFRRRRQ